MGTFVFQAHGRFQRENVTLLSKAGSKTVKDADDKSRDLHIPSGYVKGTIEHLPPTSSNPSSSLGAKANLRHLGQVMSLPGFVPKHMEKRESLVLVEDGGGYGPTQKAITNTYIDPICEKSFDSQEEFMAHWFDKHPSIAIPNLDDYREFKDFIVVAGGGHYEMNGRKGFLGSDFAYPNFVKQTIMSTGFTEQQAKFQISGDNHK